ncbi:MAG: subfamily B ATP-binding cassette protein MsbA [Methylophilaceae bacterium]|jgi:subfamily B ATP-binding cassette protein MsbA|tara:strand:+ start:1316 stop:3073 length:1758 start_codon:yes stop_codon:yes gene_type:complete
MSKHSRKKYNMPQVINAKALFLRIFSYAWRYKFVFAITIAATAVLSLSNTAFLAMLKKVTDEGFMQQPAGQAFVLPLMLLSLMSARGLAGLVSMYSMRWIARRVVEVLRIQAFGRLMHMPVSYFDTQSTGVMVSKLTYDAERLSSVATRTAMNVLRDVLTMVGLVAYMLYLDWRLTLIFAIVAPLMVLYLRKTTPKLRANAKKVQLAVGEMTKVSEEAISGQRIVKIFGAQDYEDQRFAKVVIDNRKLELRSARITGLNSFVIEVLAGLALSLVIYYALGRFSAGEFTAFMGALLMLISPIKHITAANEDFQIGLAAAQSVFEVIDAPIEVDEGKGHLEKIKGSIAFEHVSLRYEGAKRLALDDLNFTVNPGEKVALVGRSGGGKTSLVNLLPRFYELQQGSIQLDGMDVRELSLKDLRAQFSLVSQDIILFNDTIFNNIAYGVLRDTSETEVIAAAKAANAWEFIQQLPKGLQNEIGDRGVRLSGGQRQRLAIARAILKDAPILLLDEATSALDTESEQHVQAALDVLMQNRTSLVIAHRLSTIENADRILVMDKGKIVESGSHKELLKLKGYYTKLYQKEFSE